MHKKSSHPEMGDALYSSISSATGDDGRVRSRTVDDPVAQISSAWDEHQRHLKRDPHNDAHVIPVGSGQSKRAAVNFDELAASTRAPVVQEQASLRPGQGYYDQINKSIHLNSEDTNNLAHEIGHARLDEDPLGELIQSPAAQLAGIAGGATSVLGGSLAPKKYRAPLVLGGLALATPRLISEGLASLKGREALQDVGASPEELDEYNKHLLKTQFSYGMSPAIGASTLLMNKFPELDKGLLHLLRSKTGAARKLHERRKFRNLQISIENRAGSFRTWYDPHNKREGRTIQHYPYGYIRMTQGMDGDHIDCYVGDNEQAKNVYVITTNKAPDFTKVDEQKCMLGFDSAKEARIAFLKHFDNPQFFRSMKAIPYELFEKKVHATLHGAQRKIASNLSPEDYEDLLDTGMGPTHNSVPGDFLGLPQSSLIGLRKIVGDQLQPKDKIDKSFRYMDQPMGTRVLEGDTSALPESPGV